MLDRIEFALRLRVDDELAHLRAVAADFGHSARRSRNALPILGSMATLALQKKTNASPRGRNVREPVGRIIERVDL
jgi:hypothetical protein